MLATAQNFKQAFTSHKKLAATDAKKAAKPFALNRNASNVGNSSVEESQAGNRKTVAFKPSDGGAQENLSNINATPSLGVTSPVSAAQLAIGAHDIGAGIGQHAAQVMTGSGHIQELDVEYSHEEATNVPTRIESILKKKNSNL